jgi:hypothetical protein
MINPQVARRDPSDLTGGRRAQRRTDDDPLQTRITWKPKRGQWTRR